MDDLEENWTFISLVDASKPKRTVVGENLPKGVGKWTVPKVDGPSKLSETVHFHFFKYPGTFEDRPDSSFFGLVSALQFHYLWTVHFRFLDRSLS